MPWVELANGVWCANLHAQVTRDERARADIELAAETSAAWSLRRPCVLGGDLNCARAWRPASTTSPATASTTSSPPGCAPPAPPVTPDRAALSDHAPVIVDVG